MPRRRRLLAPLVVLALALAPATGARADDDRRMTVEGQGEVQRAPDLARVSVGVVTEDDTAAGALERNSAAMADVLAALEAAGLPARDVRTSEISLSPRWTQPHNTDAPPRITGFTASNGLQLVVRDLDRLGVVLDAVVRSGGNRLGGISFGLADPAEALAEARRRAVADALARAELYTGAAGVGLGRIVSIHESGSPGIPRQLMRAEMAMADAGVPVADGEITISAGVSIVFELD